jgi:hypothetical protein
MRIQITLAKEDLGVLDFDEITMETAMQLEDQTGLSVGELGAGVERLSARSLQALVWLQRFSSGQRDASLHPNFKFGDLKVEVLPDEDPTQPEEPAGSGKPSETSGTSTKDS